MKKLKNVSIIFHIMLLAGCTSFTPIFKANDALDENAAYLFGRFAFTEDSYDKGEAAVIIKNLNTNDQIYIKCQRSDPKVYAIKVLPGKYKIEKAGAFDIFGNMMTSTNLRLRTGNKTVDNTLVAEKSGLYYIGDYIMFYQIKTNTSSRTVDFGYMRIEDNYEETLASLFKETSIFKTLTPYSVFQSQ